MSPAASKHLPAPPTPPAPPHDGDCCNNDCGEACVWAQYRAALALYQQALASGPANPPRAE